MESMDSNSGSKTILWVAGGCLVLLICAAVLIFSGIGGLVWLGSQTPENAEITVNIPVEVNHGDRFGITVIITNTTASSLEINSIDISLNYLTGFHIESATPMYVELSQYEELGGGEIFQTYYFRRSIPPGESLTILFHTLALVEGDYRGSFDVCIDSEFNCKYEIARTLVR